MLRFNWVPRSSIWCPIHRPRGVQEGHLEIDNILVGNTIRPFAVGRKAWMFSGSPRAAEVSAMLYTLVETAEAKGLESRAYLRYLFDALPTENTPGDI